MIVEQIIHHTPKELKELTANKKQAFATLFQKLKKKKPKDLDSIVHQLHQEAFDMFDCLDCANCCSSISPIVIDKDIERLAKKERIKSVNFIEQHLYKDKDNDYVFKSTPCPFLMSDNYCCVYDDRPRACREYPHTNRPRFFQILNLTKKNCEICPIVFYICDDLSKRNW